MFFNAKSGSVLLAATCLCLAGCATTAPEVPTGNQILGNYIPGNENSGNINHRVSVAGEVQRPLVPTPEQHWRRDVGDADDAEGDEIDEIDEIVYTLQQTVAPITSVVIRDTLDSLQFNMRDGDVDAEAGFLGQ